MEIKRIDPNNFENINEYKLAIPVDNIRDTDDLCSIEVDGKFYIIFKNEGTIYLVENDNGELNPYEVTVDENGNLISLSTEANDYFYQREGYSYYAERKNKLSQNIDILFLNNHEDDEACLEYRQYIESICSVLIYRYNVQYHSQNNTSPIIYANYHIPTQIELHQSVGNRFFAFDKITFYYTEDDEKYRRAYIVSDRNYHLGSIRRFDGKKLIQVICDDLGFRQTIDEDLKSCMLGDNLLYNKTKKLVNNYENYILGHK